MFCDEFAQPQAFIQLSHEEQATIRRYSRSLEIHLQRGVERELKGLVLLFTHWVQASGVSLRRQSPMNTGVGAIIQPLTQSSKKKCGLRCSKVVSHFLYRMSADSAASLRFGYERPEARLRLCATLPT